MHPYIHARTASGQAGDRDRGDGRDDHVPAARRALEPGRAPAALARPAARRRDRGVHGESSALPGDLLGEPALRVCTSCAFRRRPLRRKRSTSSKTAARSCSSLHRTWRSSAQQLAPRLAGRLLYMVGDARCAVSLVGARARRDADDADRRREHRRGHAVFVRHDRPSERHQVAAAGRSDRYAERARAAREQVLRAASRLDLSFPGAAVSRRAAALVHDRQLSSAARSC